ncbi:MAG: bifunctional adenosylcobinamide kinase/adenosylcobinamide-phosphate guanylyltransferase, partial [Candidatus Omnitrophica bacterium]|nr:bifunctional adenosylcobinamide kinase/adenosylcobinamide-phosphate guanylyltransferase [Candidatus Omnitrophota bacterium]
DDEMKERIATHRRERGSQFITVEEPIHIARAIQTYSPHSDAILIDCLTFWVNNLLHHLGDNHSLITEEIEGFLKIIEDRPTSLIIVTNETTMGIVPADPLTRQFTEWQGRLNQEVAKRADEVIFMVSGLPQVLKSSSHESHIKAH